MCGGDFGESGEDVALGGDVVVGQEDGVSLRGCKVRICGLHEVEVWQGEEMLFTLTGGISISENPVFRFRYLDNGAPGFRVRMQDTEGNVVEQTLPKEPAT